MEHKQRKKKNHYVIPLSPNVIKPQFVWSFYSKVKTIWYGSSTMVANQQVAKIFNIYLLYSDIKNTYWYISKLLWEVIFYSEGENLNKV